MSMLYGRGVKFKSRYLGFKPGPASSVVELLLCKFCPRGPQFDPRQGSFFSDRETHLCLTEIPTFGRVLPINATPTRTAVVAPLLSEEEHSLGNWSYDVTASSSGQ